MFLRHTILTLAILAATIATTLPAATTDTWQWQPTGPGGGGRFLGPALSPHNPALLFCTSDMGAAYRSTNTGASWDMIPQAQLRRIVYSLPQPHHTWAFHPTDKNLILVSTIFGYHRSTDAGKTWILIDGPWDPSPPPPPPQPTSAAARVSPFLIHPHPIPSPPFSTPTPPAHPPTHPSPANHA